MKIFGYRGYSGQYPENTMLAFQKAIEFGADGIQLDIHFSRDRQIVIIHDDSLSRITNGVGFVRHHYLKDLKNYEIKGSYEGDRQHILTLEEYLQWVEDLPVVTNISLKNDRFFYPGLEEETMALVNKYKMVDRVILSSKRESSIALLKEKWPEVKSGWELEHFSDELIEKIIAHRPDYLIPSIQCFNERFMEAVKELGIPVIPYSVNTIEDMERMEYYETEGICTMFLKQAKETMGLKENPYSPEQIEQALAPPKEEEILDQGPSGKIRQQSKKLTGGVMGIFVGILVSISAAVIVTKIAFSFLVSFFS